jgi:integrase
VKRLFRLKDAKGNKLLAIEPFSPHDFRRTLRMHLSRLGIALHIAEKCLNHSLTKLGKTYDKHTYRTNGAKHWKCGQRLSTWQSTLAIT